ncbi:c-type cytochrome biogenesis protein CcmI [Serpens gallinarum]|uniref:C-type cytochrome biogenesis protein CcmI n=1 Tax=Serpens gallinarum TaxID=2763075 RepID=A0ABR8TLA7_9PSED|nr:c-type cytochrome biogenesis protein CcmI [Serpens gallinarum]MBD7976542.1 c-type cytochrome biogenesis protein CcmI [Serpens gallinarum]
MIDFWLAAVVLLLVALAFILIPVLRGRHAQREEDRTALNVALFEERQAELETQHAAGTLNNEQFAAGKAEAARELLADTENVDVQRSAHLGRTAPLLAAVLVPVLGLGLYMYWGASDKLELSRQFDQAPASMSEMVARLEQAVKAQPEAAEGWYYLARAYMVEERPADAAKAFERTVTLAGRDPALLGQWAQALYFAGGQQWSEQIQSLTREALHIDPEETTTLGLLGISAFEAGRFAEAVEHWERLVATLPADDPSRAAIQSGIERARAQAGDQSQGTQAAPVNVQLKMRVELGAQVRDQVQPGDTVFVFARAVDGPPAPLAAKRLSVAELPAELTFTDADAMLPQLRLSNFPKVELVARISRGGDPQSGEWIGRSKAVDSSNTQLQQLVIDQPDRP